MEKENKALEYKSDLTKSYLKTVSAFANYGTGRIIFGVTDDYRIVPISDAKSFCESLENQMNDSLKPVPKYTLTIQKDKTICLTVYQGENTPYLYNNKAYRRNDSATIEVDDYEMKRLILQGRNLNFEQLPSRDQNLTFHYLSEKFKEILNVQKLDLDTMKTLGLYSDKDGYNVVACLLADKNDFYGLDIAVFGEDANTFKERVDLSGESVVKQYFDAIVVFERNYVVEKIVGTMRERIEKVPYEAFREALANAIIHRTYDVRIKTKVAFYSDHIEITSPGGLPSNLSKEQYLQGNISAMRNPNLAGVFHRLNIAETFATGIPRIKSCYENSLKKPDFRIFDTSVTVILPLISKQEPVLTKPESDLLKLLENNIAYTRSEIEEATRINKATLIRLLNSLIKKGLLIKEGKSSATTYRKAN